MSTPWIEKYRPTDFDKIVLSRDMRETMTQWIHQKRFPNILLYGPPGTGKTTTAWNLIRKYQKEVEGITETTHIYNDSHNVISLNASDDKGIDTLRQRIHIFVQGKPLFHKNTLKFVILDEIDHMTPYAQRMLCFILQEYQDKVRYVLICNYISHLDKRLRNQVHTLTFYGMSQQDIKQFLLTLCEKENIPLGPHSPFFSRILLKYDCDIRSMINSLQQYSHTLHEYKDETLREQFETFSASLVSLSSFLQWVRTQSTPKETLHVLLQYAEEFALLPEKWIYEGMNMRWDGQTSISGVLPHQTSDAFTELVVWYVAKN